MNARKTAWIAAVLLAGAAAWLLLREEPPPAEPVRPAAAPPANEAGGPAPAPKEDPGAARARLAGLRKKLEAAGLERAKAEKELLRAAALHERLQRDIRKRPQDPEEAADMPIVAGARIDRDQVEMFVPGLVSPKDVGALSEILGLDERTAAELDAEHKKLLLRFTAPEGGATEEWKKERIGVFRDWDELLKSRVTPDEWLKYRRYGMRNGLFAGLDR